MMPGRRRGQGGSNMYAMMLLYRLWERLAELEQKPPVTIALIAVNFFLYAARQPAAVSFLRALPPQAMTLFRMTQPYLAVKASCINPTAVVLKGERHRLLLSTLIHLDDVHLLYNMLSLVHKGVTLETQMGSATFAGLVAYLAFVSNVLYCAVAFLFKQGGVNSRLWGSCAAGFSGVLFGLGSILTTSGNYRAAAQSIFVCIKWHFTLPVRSYKPLTSSDWRLTAFIFFYAFLLQGFPVPNAGISILMELVANQMLVPRASFTGHACGAAAGVSFLLATQAISQWSYSRSGTEGRRPRTYGSGVSGHAHAE